MRTRCPIIALCLAGLAQPCIAQDVTGDLTVYGGIAATSNYVSNGATQTDDGPALQGFLEVQRNGFYAGAWASQVELDADRIELDLYLGYRKQLENNLFVDIGYAQYLYDDSGNCCGEIKLRAAYPLLDDFAIEGYLAYNPDSRNWNRSARLAYAASDALGLSARYGRSDSSGLTYWDAGVSYAVTDAVAVEMRYFGSDQSDAGLVLGLSVATEQSSIARLLLAPFGQ